MNKLNQNSSNQDDILESLLGLNKELMEAKRLIHIKDGKIKKRIRNIFNVD